MAVAFVQGVSSNGSAGSSPQAAPAFASAVAVGDLIVVLAGGDGGATGLATSVSDSLGNTYTRVPSFDIANAGGTLNLDAFYSVATHAGSSNVVSLTFNSVSENCVVVAQHFNGFTGTATLDLKKTSSNASSTTVTSGASASIAQAVELIIGLGIYTSTATTYTLGSGYTNLTQVNIANRGAAMESKVTSAIAAQTATFTLGAARVNLGALLAFKDVAISGSAPTVTTSAATSIAQTTATGNGNVTSDGGNTITERGVCWSTSANPTTSNSKATASGTTGAYTASMTGLLASTTYHYRAYAINAVGTSYGADTTFTTSGWPAFSTLSDNFDDNSRSASWATNFSFDGTQVFERNQRVEITHASTAQYNALSTASLYDLTGSSVFWRLVDAGNQALTSHEVIAQMYLDTNNTFYIDVSGNNIYVYKKIAGTQTQVGTAVAYVSTTHKWFKFSESGGTITAAYSTDGLSWTTLQTFSNPFAVTGLTMLLQAGCYATEASGSYAYYDNYNITPSAAVITGQFFPFMGL